MASDPALVERLRAVLAHHRHIEARRMFGGACFTLNGNMCVGVHNTNLILRVGEARAKELLTREGVKPMDLTGKVMKGWRQYSQKPFGPMLSFPATRNSRSILSKRCRQNSSSPAR